MTNRKPKLIEEKEISFSTEGRLLQELGERLVISSDLAIVELIKNSFDADSPSCFVNLDSIEKTLSIEDKGHGMTFDDFKSRWMTIATSSKQKDPQSRTYKRKLTGAKGIGRFAVRFLGEELQLETIAFDDKYNAFTKLECLFDWKEVDKFSSLQKYKVPYKLFLIGKEAQTGTKLIIKKVKHDSINPDNIKTDVLKIVSPISGLERGKFILSTSEKLNVDPGFKVIFEKGFAESEEKEVELAEYVLRNYWARLVVKLDNEKLEYKINFNYSDDKAEKIIRLKYPNKISNGLYADIRFFPKRAGIFQEKGIKGDIAWKWVRDNSGIAVVDHGFRIKPYGFKDDDWLHLDADHSHSQRDWRTDIMKSKFKMDDQEKNDPAMNPMLNIPVNYQLIGAVFVESKQRGKLSDDLIPAMDREGFIENHAFVDLHEVVRGGLEYLAMVDKKEELKKDEIEAKLATKNLRKDLKSAIEDIENDPTIPTSQKIQMVKTYSLLAKEVDDIDDYNRKARENLEVVSLLGVVSGFMTHETERILTELKSLAKDLKDLEKKDSSLHSKVGKINKAISELEGQLSYSSLFIRSIHTSAATRFKARPQIDLLIEKFGDFAKRRNIEHLINVDDDVTTPAIYVNIYSGVILNLYTNAVKAILMKNALDGSGKIMIRIWNVQSKHIIEVADNGIGIPESLKDRIWDPLFTTTSKLNSPMGTGMGLGLSLVKKIMKDVGGNIRLVDPPKDFITCIRADFPIH